MRACHDKKLRERVYFRWSCLTGRVPKVDALQMARARMDLEILEADHCTPRMNWRALDPHRWLPNHLADGVPWVNRRDIRTQIVRIGR